MTPLLRKGPDKIILHVGTNDAPDLSPNQLLDGILELKKYILERLPSVKLVISAPVLRVDKANANETNLNFIELLKSSELDKIYHPNVTEEHLDRYGLHLNNRGSKVLGKNFISCVQNI